MDKNKTNRQGILNLIFAGVVVLFVIIFFKGCFDTKGETTEVTIPEITGSAPIIKPVQNNIVIRTNAGGPIITGPEKHFGPNLSKSEVDRWKSEFERVSKEYDSLDQAFANANDSLQQIIYRSAIEPKAFSRTWDNDTIRTTIKGLSSGPVHALKLDYTIKPRKEIIKMPQTVFRLISGIEIGATKDLSKTNFKANLGFQNKSGSIISASVDTDERIYVGYSFSIFSIKR